MADGEGPQRTKLLPAMGGQPRTAEQSGAESGVEEIAELEEAVDIPPPPPDRPSGGIKGELARLHGENGKLRDELAELTKRLARVERNMGRLDEWRLYFDQLVSGSEVESAAELSAERS